MKAGAFDYVQKPFEIEEMEVKIEKALEVKRLKHELDYLRHASRISTSSTASSARAKRLQRVLDIVEEGCEEQHDRARSAAKRAPARS